MDTGTTTPRVIAYSRVSTTEQADSGLGLEAQRERLNQEASRRGWSGVVHVSDDGYSAKDLNRPAISEALEALDAGEADVLMVAKLDRLSRSVLDFAALMERARRRGWDLVVLDLGVDTGTPAGALMANVMASFAQYERQLIGQRTSDALARKAAQGHKLGRPVELADDVRHRIAAEREAGATYQAIADRLNAEGIPTAQGGKQWHRATVRKVIASLEHDAKVAAR